MLVVFIISVALWSIGLGLLLTRKPTEKPPVNQLGRFTLPLPEDPRWRFSTECGYRLGNYRKGEVYAYAGCCYHSLDINGNNIQEADPSIKDSQVADYCKAVKKAHEYKKHEAKAKRIQEIEDGYKALMENK